VKLDLTSISVPFRMQPGLRRLEPAEPQLELLKPGSQLHTEKKAVFDVGASRFAIAGFDPARALAAIRERLPSEQPPELAYEQDFAVLDGNTGTLPWLCVCVPSHWAPEEKLGLDFTALHAPVADNQLLTAASGHLVKLATSGECWERFVWTVSPSNRYDQHPLRHARTPWPATENVDEFAAACWLRSERQTFFPVGAGTKQAVFTIRVMLEPFTDAAQSPGAARRLHDSMSSMSPAVLQYKGLAGAVDRLLPWLAARSA
jgi:hypothetical protein